jgi:hypothetical protein
LGTLCRATLVKLQFFLNTFVAKVFVQMMMRGEGERKSSLFSKPSRAADPGMKKPKRKNQLGLSAADLWVGLMCKWNGVEN